MVLAPIVRGRKGEFKKELEKLAKEGFIRARVDGELLSLDEEIRLDKRRNHTIEAVVDRLLVLDADSPVHLRDRGSVLVRMRRLHEGAAAWDRYLRRFPSAQDAETFREQLRKVRQKLGALN